MSGYLRQWRLPANSIRSGRSRRPSLINKVFLLLEHRRIFRTTLETVVVENPRRKAAPHSNSRDNVLMFDASINWSAEPNRHDFIRVSRLKCPLFLLGRLSVLKEYTRRIRVTRKALGSNPMPSATFFRPSFIGQLIRPYLRKPAVVNEDSTPH